jgi:citrate lyase subunit beta / citryl-CoA lyase
LVAAALVSGAGGAAARYVRVNARDSAWCLGDLEAVMPARPDGIMPPKLMGPEDLQRLSGLMEGWELPAQRDLTKIIPVCTETPAATLSLAAKSWAHPRLAVGPNACSPRSTPALQAWCRSMASCWMRRTVRRQAAS